MIDEGLDGAEELALDYNLSQREKELRDRFISEYLKDYNPTAAALRIGFAPSLAVEWGGRFLHDQYVQKQLTVSNSSGEESELEEIRRNQVLAGLMREANDTAGSAAPRVAALSKLASIYGMDAPQKSEVTHNGDTTVNVKHQIDMGDLDDEQRKLLRELLNRKLEDDESN